MFRAPRVLCEAGLLDAPVGGGPPARLGVLTSFGAAPRSPPVPSGPSGALHTCGAGALIGASSRSPARPRHRPRAPRPGPATAHGRRGQAPPPPTRLGNLASLGAASRSPPVPSGPSGALHTSGAWCAEVWLGALSRDPARPRQRPRAPQPGPPVPPGPSNPSNRPVLGRESPKTQTTSVKMREFGVFWARWSAFWAHGGYE